MKRFSGVLLVTACMCAAMGLYFLIAELQLPARSTKTALDDAVPLWPHFVWLYLSIYLAGPLFALGADRETLKRASPRLLAILLGLFLSFLLVPTVVERPPLDPHTLSERLLAAVYLVDHTARNAAPSGHVALAVFVAWLFFAHQRARILRVAVVVYTGLVVVSVVLTGQHHVVDLLSGVALAAFVLVSARWVDRRRGSRARSHPR